MSKSINKPLKKCLNLVDHYRGFLKHEIQLAHYLNNESMREQMRKLRSIIPILLTILLVSCANLQQSENLRQENSKIEDQRADIAGYVSHQRPKFLSGEIKGSEYYRGLYRRWADSSFSDRGFMMSSIAASIEKSLAYENGQITKDEFELFGMKNNATIAEHEDQLKAERRQYQEQVNVVRQQQYMQLLRQNQQQIDLNYVNPIIQISPVINTHCNTIGNYTNCTSR